MEELTQHQIKIMEEYHVEQMATNPRYRRLKRETTRDRIVKALKLRGCYYQKLALYV